MKAIAEYFRDLAADDRYFGAEPPTPDAEMLTRIAEREIERRVQARQESGAIVLSASPKVAEDVAEATPQQAEAQEQEAPVVAPVDAEAPTEIEDDAAGEEQAAVAEADDVDHADQDEMSDIRNVMQRVQDEPVAEVDEAPIVEDEDVADAAEEFFATSETEVDETYVEDEVEEDDVAADAIAEDVTPVEEAPAEEDSIAAKLRRIRAVVSRADVSDDEDDDYIEDQHAEEVAPIDLAEDILPDETLETSEEGHADDAAELNADDISDLEDALEADEDIAPVQVKRVEVTPRPRARVIRMKRAEREADEADDLQEAVADEVVSVEDVAQDAPASALSDEDEADLMAELAEVDAELEVDISDDQDEVVDEDEPEMADSAEDDVEDADEDDAVEATAEADDLEEDEADDEEAAKAERQARRLRRRARRAKLEEQEPGDEAVERLIEEANTKLDEPDGSRRRSAIAHLRAAVAATKAEKEAGKSFEKVDQSDAYRDDLADAVRPKRTERQAPPLKLVAEQRIDEPSGERAGGIRPRRVSIEDVAAAEANESSSNFVEFAEKMGATQLPEVLEAAASYLTFVEGRNKFSRPMLMRLAYQVGDDRFEREAGLRSFGQLLREKKIEKIAGGRFTVSEAINFKPDDRAAG
nr:hypothetical protein [Cognatishimia maritima]